MEKKRIYLTRDKTVYIDLSENKVFDKEVNIHLQNQEMEILKLLLEKRNEFCSYAEIYNSVWQEPYYGTMKPITERVNKMKSRLKDRIEILSVGTAVFDRTDVKKYDITFVNTSGRDGGYNLYLGNDYEESKTDYVNEIDEEIEKYEAVRSEIATGYYNKYKIFHWRHPSNKMNRSLMEVFTYPTFIGNEDSLSISEMNNIYICAPNGFGKTTLLQTLLLIMNPSIELMAEATLTKKMKELRNYYEINEDHLALYIDLKSLNKGSAYNKDTDLCKWLLYAADINEFKIKLEDFRKTVTYYNEIKRLVLIFDGLDEVVKIHESDISRDDVLNKISLLVNADEICGNAKLIISSRPLIYEKYLGNFKYLFLESLITQPELVQKIIDNYAPLYNEKLKEYIYGDLYLKHVITTPAILVDVIIKSLKNMYDEEAGLEGLAISKFRLIRDIIRNTMVRFDNKYLYNYRETDYDLIYERLAYISLFHDIENNPSDFAIIQDMILDSDLILGNRNRREINAEDISNAYEHFSLINSQEHFIEFLSPEVFRPYYLAAYMYKYYKFKKNQFGCEKEKWEMFESVINNKKKIESWLYDMLVFYFGILHEGFDLNHRLNVESYEYNAWIDYIVFKWNSKNTTETSKQMLKSMLNYLLESDFVKDSCLEWIISSDRDLQDNEKQIKSILHEIM